MSDSVNFNGKTSKSRTGFWIVDILLALSLIAVWVWNFNITLPGATDYQIGSKIGEVVGMATLYGIISFIIFRFALKKRKGFGLVVFLSLLLIASTFKLSYAVNNHEESQAFTKSMVDILEAVSQGRSFDTTSISMEELGTLRPVMTFLTTYVTEQQNLFIGTFGDLDSCFRDILTPERLSTGDELRKSRIKLVRADSVINTYESRLFKLIDSASVQVESLKENNDSKMGFIDGFKGGCKNTRKRVAELMSIERRFVLAADSVLNFLLLNEKGHYFENSQIFFTTQDDADRYNSLVDTINGLASEEQAWRSGAQALIDEKLTKLKKE